MILSPKASFLIRLVLLVLCFSSIKLQSISQQYFAHWDVLHLYNLHQDFVSLLDHLKDLDHHYQVFLLLMTIV